MPKRKPKTAKQRLDNLLKGARANFKQARLMFDDLDLHLSNLDPKEWDRDSYEGRWWRVKVTLDVTFEEGHKQTMLARRRTNEANRLAKEIYSVVPAEYSKAIKSLYDTYLRVGVETNNRVLARMQILAREVEREVVRKEMAIRERERFAKLAREKAEAREIRKSTPPTSQVSNWWDLED